MLNKYGKFSCDICTFQAVTSYQQHQKQKIKTKQKKHSNPNKSKWEAKYDGRDHD